MILAATGTFDVFDTFLGWQRANQGFRDALLVATAAVVATLAILLWAVFVRKRRDRPSYQIPTPKSDQQPPAATAKRRKWRRRRKDHRPRNPTLAETGGLPPVKPPSRHEPMN